MLHGNTKSVTESYQYKNCWRNDTNHCHRFDCLVEEPDAWPIALFLEPKHGKEITRKGWDRSIYFSEWTFKLLRIHITKFEWSSVHHRILEHVDKYTNAQFSKNSGHIRTYDAWMQWGCNEYGFLIRLKLWTQWRRIPLPKYPNNTAKHSGIESANQVIGGLHIDNCLIKEWTDWLHSPIST